LRIGQPKVDSQRYVNPRCRSNLITTTASAKPRITIIEEDIEKDGEERERGYRKTLLDDQRMLQLIKMMQNRYHTSAPPSN